ncbi:MAG: hypothetical protein JXJ17_17095 [Anaerolineae bacterium]|nr:hypothetical protein [Anaerolineae bacterium]
MKVGWLYDHPGQYAGGAELEVMELLDAVPEGVEIVQCPPEKVSADVDVYVIHNCVSYGRSLLPLLADKPVVKRVHDVWPHGDGDLRRWLLTHARLVLLSSPIQHEEMPWRIDAPVEYVPSPVDIGRFRRAGMTGSKRAGTVWLGRLTSGKGLEQAHRWAVEQGCRVDVYGFGPLRDAIRPPLIYCGPVTYLAVPKLLARYERFLFLPDAVEPFGRTVVEAWAAGCEMIVNHNVGALWWIERDPAALDDAADRFWRLVLEAAR